MIIQLQIEDVDKLLNLYFSVQKDISFKREIFDTPQHITYTVKFENKAKPAWDIKIYSIGKYAEIHFPVYINEPDNIIELRGGGFVHLTETTFEPKNYSDPVDKEVHSICLSILLKLREHEDLNMSSSNLKQTEEDIESEIYFDEEIAPEEEADLILGLKAKKLGITAERLERWYKLIKYREKYRMTILAIAEREGKAVRTIMKDFQDMKEKKFNMQ